jgi:hypothetical protein
MPLDFSAAFGGQLLGSRLFSGGALGRWLESQAPPRQLV